MARLRKPIRPILNTGTTRPADQYGLNGPATPSGPSKIIEINYRWTDRSSWSNDRKTILSILRYLSSQRLPKR